MGGSNFDQIAQALLEQKQHMDELLAEHQALQQQLAQLREGRGIYVEIDGRRFELGTMLTEDVTPAIEAEPEIIAVPQASVAAIPETPAATIAEVTPVQAAQPAAPDTETVEPVAPPATPTFLEEIMLDEFSAALTSPMAVWQGPVKKAETTNEEEERKASLRRELMGSYLLE